MELQHELWLQCLRLPRTIDHETLFQISTDILEQDCYLYMVKLLIPACLPELPRAGSYRRRDPLDHLPNRNSTSPGCLHRTEQQRPSLSFDNELALIAPEFTDAAMPGSFFIAHGNRNHLPSTSSSVTTLRTAGTTSSTSPILTPASSSKCEKSAVIAVRM